MSMTPIIDNDICTRCGACAEVCPRQVLVQGDGGISVAAAECMLCSHCYCVCPVDAIRFHSLRPPEFRTISYKEETVDGARIDPGLLVGLFRSRRSVRRFEEKPVPGDAINDLLEAAVTAPSGSNRQNWEFTVINGRDKVWHLAGMIGEFFVKIQSYAGNPLIRYLSVPFLGTALIRYYRERYESVARGLREAEKGHDLLFHGAPALILFHSAAEGSTPREDAQYASYNVALLAHLIGMGTCYIGYAVEALNRVSAIRRSLGIPKGNRVHAVLAIGYPAVRFTKPALRKPYRTDWR